MRVLFIFCLCFLISFSSPVEAAKPTKGKSLMLMELESGKVLYEENGFTLRYPASLTKMMTIYLLLDYVDRTALTLDTKMIASKNAASQPSTHISLKEGDRISIRDAVKALIVRSANDVAVVAAEFLARDERTFGALMTQKARQLGMKHTQFKNASGLPNSQQYSTPYDIAILARAMHLRFPQHTPLFKETKFTWNGKTYRSHNNLLGNYPGVDGMKTGYIRASGFHLAASYLSPKDNKRYIAIYMGADNSKERKQVLTKLLDSLEGRRLQQLAYRF